MLHLFNVFLKGFIMKKDDFFQLLIDSKMRLGLYFGFYFFGYITLKRNSVFVSKLEYYLPRNIRFRPDELVRECPSIVCKYRSLSSFLPRFINGLNYLLFHFVIYPSVD